MSRKKQAAAGAPGWMVTFADLMSLLVTFFVLIISFSIQDQVKLEIVAGSVREAFGIVKDRRFAGVIDMQGTPERRQPGNVRRFENQTADGDAPTLSDMSKSGVDTDNTASDNASSFERARFQRAKSQIENALRVDPELRESAEQVTIQMTEEGLSVMLVDNDGRSMFDSGSVEPSPRAKRLLTAIGDIAATLPNRIRIEGHTDAQPIRGGSLFALSAERADAARKILDQAGVKDDRIDAVVGKGASDPLYVEDPYLPGNRRISIVLLKSAPLLPGDHSL